MRLTRRAARLAALTCAGLAWAAAARAGTLFADPYGAGPPDVLGSESDFDIRSLEVQELSPAALQITLRLSYHGGDLTLAPFTATGASFAAVPVAVGDVLIQGRSSLWAIPLSGAVGGGPGGIYYAAAGPVAVGTPVTRDTVLPGSLYRVTGTLSAAQVLGAEPADDFRPDAAVWGAIDTFSPDFVGYAPLSYALGGSEVGVQLQIAIGPAFYEDVSGGYRVHFASTTCACDVLDAAVPEPAPLALALCAFALCAARARLCLPRRGGLRGRERD